MISFKMSQSKHKELKKKYDKLRDEKSYYLSFYHHIVYNLQKEKGRVLSLNEKSKIYKDIVIDGPEIQRKNDEIIEKRMQSRYF